MTAQYEEARTGGNKAYYTLSGQNPETQTLPRMFHVKQLYRRYTEAKERDFVSRETLIMRTGKA